MASKSKSGVRFNLADSGKIRAFLARLDPASRDSVAHEVMVGAVKLGATEAATVHIIRGRGADAPALANRLTWRSGHLARSISTDISGAPQRYIFGTPIVYGAVHEQGGTVVQRVRTHRRTVAFGRVIPGGFTVPAFGRKLKMKKRPFLEPAARKVMRVDVPELFRRALEAVAP